jgi:mannose-6-phosphate isomerase
MQLHTDSAENNLSCLIGPELTDCFTVKRASIKTELPREEQSFFIGIVAEGSGAIVIDGESIALKQWETFFLPASVEKFTYITDSHLSILECYPGQTPAHSLVPVK